jgi:hypothetical protein
MIWTLPPDREYKCSRKLIHRKHTYKVILCTILVSSRYHSMFQKFRAEKIYMAFVFPCELRWFHYNCRPCQNNDTFCQKLAPNSRKFAMCHVKRTAVICNLLKMLYFRDGKAKICTLSPAPHRSLTVRLVGPVTCSTSQNYLNLYDSFS